MITSPAPLPSPHELAVTAFIAANPELARRFPRRVIAAHLARLAWRLQVVSAMRIDGSI